MISITSDVSLWYKSCCKNILNYDNNKWKKLKAVKNRFSLIAEQMLTFVLSTCLDKLRIFQTNCQAMFYIKDNSHSDMTYHKLHWEIVSIRTYCWLRNVYFVPTNNTVTVFQIYKMHISLHICFWFFDIFIVLNGISSNEVFQAFVLVKSNNWFSVFWKSFLYSFICL